MNLYILPASETGLNDEIFNDKQIENRGGVTNLRLWQRFKEECLRRGITPHTTDFWSPEKAEPDDILLVQNHPGESFFWRLFYFLKHPKTRGGFTLERRRFFLKNYRFFKRRVLWHAESPMATPYVYEHIDAIWKSGMYDKITLLARDPAHRYSHIDYYSIRDYNFESVYFNDPKEKFLVMINSNTAPHSFGDEQYGERLRAIKYFAEKPDSGFDLYGYRWDKAPRHPRYFFYKKYVDKVWRGVVDDKLKVLSGYKFSLCFENCSYPGYISEKIYDCLAVGCIPVYFGAPDVTDIVPASCFIDFKQFKNYEELEHHLRSLTPADLEKYRANIAAFLRDDSNMKGIASLVDEVAG